MSRICKAYETRFRWLLQQVHARQLERGVASLLERARRVSAAEHLSLAQALTRTYEDLAARPAFRSTCRSAAPGLFFCDAGLGGLARWLRAAGHDALWRAGIDDDELLREARRLSATLLTTDSMLMERRLLRDRLIPSFWLPPTLTIPEQLALVFREFHLQPGPPRCMSCGGELRRVEKESLRDRVPPRTYRWLNEYFRCTRCDKVLWQGTHWGRIVRTLHEVAGTARPGAQ